MAKSIDLTGQRYGRLVVVDYYKSKKDAKGKPIRYWKCRCDCGNIVNTCTNNLRRGNTKSCGCLRRDKTRQINYKHGQKETRLYQIWGSMKKRCYNAKHNSFNNYGGKGISVCDEWLGEHGFENFHKWAIENNYSDELTLDRINTQGNYTPDNCRWATWTEQENNRSNNRYFYYDGKNLSAKEWSKLTGISLGTLLNRLYSLGWSVERALTEPVHKGKYN